MKKFEYKNFHEKPLLQLNPQQFADFILETLNKLGQQGWQAITVHTPQAVNAQQQPVLTGDIFILAMREVGPVYTDLEIALVKAFRPQIEKFLTDNGYYEKEKTEIPLQGGGAGNAPIR